MLTESQTIYQRFLTKKSTPRQRAAVNFCEEVFPNLHFDGNIEDFEEVSSFLSLYLEDAKYTFDGIKCEYESYIENLD